MENEEKILAAIASLTSTMEKGFSDMTGRFEAIERRLDQQEADGKRAYRQQQLQEADIQKLKEIVRDLAENRPVRVWEDATAIQKKDAYRNS